MLWVKIVLKGLSRTHRTWSAERKMAKQSSTYWRNKRGSNCLTEFSLCTNYDSFVPLSFIHFGIPYNLKSTLQQTEEVSCVIEILLSLMYSRMVLMVVFCRYRIPFDANGCVSMLMNVTFYARKKKCELKVTEGLMNVDWIKWMYFCVNEFEVGVNDCTFSGNEQ